MAIKFKELAIISTLAAVSVDRLQGTCTAVANPAVYGAWCNAYSEAHCNPSFVGNHCEWVTADEKVTENSKEQ
eukprot:Awhi_evm1s6035